MDHTANCVISVNPDAIFDVQVKRIHEYKRQLVEHPANHRALASGSFENPKCQSWVPRVKIFGGKSAPGYAAAKEIIHLINDVAARW